MIRILKAFASVLTHRLFLVGTMIALQLAALLALILFASKIGAYAYPFLTAVSVVAVFFIISAPENPSYKITWIVAILLMPVVGGVFYILFGNKRLPAPLEEFAKSAMRDTKSVMPDNRLSEKLTPHLERLCDYIYNMSGYPSWKDGSSRFFPLGEEMFNSMLEKIKAAKRYVFLEYFIIRPGYMLEALLALLEKKAAEGLEVRLLYDDIGTAGSLPKDWEEKISAAGVRRLVFNPFKPRMSVILNYRDHRKLCIVDGVYAFCGGINLADEYINRLDRFGHWKDTGVLLEGPAVWGFVHMYLQLWAFAEGGKPLYSPYLPELGSPEWDRGLVQVFGDSPLDRVNVTENVYHGIISRAERYVYITTPYLVIDYAMEAALCAAAESGLDVRIMAPYRYDKWYVHILTRSHYPRLIRSGVKIYEYTPGFMHGKTFVSDDQVCMVGTCNIDFRSFYLHFECSVCFYNSNTVLAVRDDFLSCQTQCHQITLDESLKSGVPLRVLRAFLKIFAPLF
ncbi:MAG: phospholipase D-like domain-containing protein [Oscillospiraceae bacterium]|nr:phospholipase D-like domain-containing protein [Oscillospiraceae bacterium]